MLLTTPLALTLSTLSSEQTLQADPFPWGELQSSLWPGHASAPGANLLSHSVELRVEKVTHFS